ncbi:MAG: response regulator, partial [Sphingobacteriales bacterium]
ADSVGEALGMIAEFKPEFVLLDIYLKGKLTGIDLAQRLGQMNIPFIYISANSNQKVLEDAKHTNPYGFVIKPFREKDVLVALDIAIYRHENQLKQGERQNALLQKKAAGILASAESWEHKLLQMGKALQSYIPFEFLSVGRQQTRDDSFYELCFSRVGFDEYQLIGPAELMVITNLKQHELAALKGSEHINPIATWYDENEFSQLITSAPFKKLFADTYGLRSHLTLPVTDGNSKTYCFNFYSRRADAYDAVHLVQCKSLLQPLIAFMQSMQQLPNNPLFAETGNYAVHHEFSARELPNPFNDIIGNSHLLLTVFDHVAQVSPSDCSVLILGESGTGKEKIAGRIHALSPRKDKPFIRIN